MWSKRSTGLFELLKPFKKEHTKSLASWWWRATTPWGIPPLVSTNSPPPSTAHSCVSPRQRPVWSQLQGAGWAGGRSHGSGGCLWKPDDGWRLWWVHSDPAAGPRHWQDYSSHTGKKKNLHNHHTLKCFCATSTHFCTKFWEKPLWLGWSFLGAVEWESRVQRGVFWHHQVASFAFLCQW